MANSNEYMRVYMRRRYHARRREAVDRLGGVCASCGKKEDLQFDHIDPSQKSFSIGRLWSCSKERFLTELAKCQLLCGGCHREKHAPRKHGTLSMYRYCKCAACRGAKADYMKRYKRPNRSASGA